MIAYDEHGRIYFNLYVIWIIAMVAVGLSQGIWFLMERARDKRERRAREARNLSNAVIALNRHAVVVDKAIKRLKRRGLK